MKLLALHIVATHEIEEFAQDILVFVEHDEGRARLVEHGQGLIHGERPTLDRAAHQGNQELTAYLSADASRPTFGGEAREVRGGHAALLVRTSDSRRVESDEDDG